MSRIDLGREHQLAHAFVRLADTLVSGFDLVELFDDLIRTLVEIFDLSAAGLMMMDNAGKLRLVASSSERSRLVELLELQADQGPCLDAFGSGALVAVEGDHEQAQRWPALSRLLREAELGAAYGLPMRLREDTIGAVNLFHRPGETVATGDLVTAQALADVATIATLQARASRASVQLAEQLQAALNSRVTIEQAKGVLAERGKVDMQAAFDRLRGFARSHNLRLTEVAEAVAKGRLDAAEVLTG
ncbi:MAG TPA: GAF and ANTAR domain-containing protein [Marmoricola sp.]